MAKDYKNSGRRKKNKKTGLPGWAWLTVGLAIGLFVALLVYLDNLPDRETSPDVAEPQSQDTVKAQEANTQASPSSSKNDKDTTRYDFYTILPEMEVVVPEEEVAPSREDPRDEVPRTPKEPGAYVLQAGSFRDYKQADRMKARLALLGVEADIHTVTINGGERWHRVRIGPFDQLGRLKQVRSRLRDNDVDVILLKVKG